MKREWIADYAGTYSSDMCTLEIDTAGSVPAVFKLVVKSGELAGTYEHDWEGGSGPGNDSYYRFTTDATFTTTKTLNFSAGEETSDGEASIGLRVENLDTTPTFKANLQITITTPFENKLVECGALTH